MEQCKEKTMKILIEIAVRIVVLSIFVACIAIMSGCSPKTIETVIVKTDTCFIQKTQRDSIYINDSIYIREVTAGDTVWITTEKWHTRWRDRIVRDTSYIAKCDTVLVTKTREISKPLSAWQSFQIVLGRLALMAIVAVIIYFLIRHKLF